VWDKLGRAREGEGSRPEVKIFVFLFLKILNSAEICLFYCELIIAPKMMKIFV
jgi:hypothetical protein